MSLKNLSVISKIPKILKNKLKNKRISNIYKKFERSLDINQNFIVAVSGGPDSLALAFLSKVYSIKKKLNCKYLIVDHKLRLGSTNEAKLVKEKLKKFAIDAEILTWKGQKPTKNIQSVARQKRYELLFKRCNQLQISSILLGHHQGDLLENFFIRILRGSGLKGLVSLDKKVKISQIFLYRPLLDQTKKDLEFLSKYVFNFYVKDPYNEDEKFQRIRIRKILEELKNNGLDEKKFIKTLSNLKGSNKVVEFYVEKNLKKNSFFYEKKNHLILKPSFFQQPDEIVFRSFSDSLQFIGRKYYAVRGIKLTKIIYQIKNNVLFKATLGGCIIEKVNETVIISKER